LSSTQKKEGLTGTRSREEIAEKTMVLPRKRKTYSRAGWKRRTPPNSVPKNSGETRSADEEPKSKTLFSLSWEKKDLGGLTQEGRNGPREERAR